MDIRMLATAAVTALALAAATAGAKDASNTGVQLPSSGLRSGAEEVAAQLLEAMKQGNARTFLGLLDLKALYKDAARNEGEQAAPWAFWTFVRDVHRAAKDEFGGRPDEGFDYRIVGSEHQGDETIVTVAFQSSTDAEWEEHRIPFTGAGGEWKITLEGMKAFDFGYGTPGPIGRGTGSSEKALEEVLEAVKTGDADVIIDRIDLKGIYEASLPEEQRRQITYENFERMARQAVKQHLKPNPEFDYEIISSKTKGDTTTARVKTKENKDAEWEESEVSFKKIRGKWMITWEDIVAMSD